MAAAASTIRWIPRVCCTSGLKGTQRGYIWADEQLEANVRPEQKERFKRSGVLHGAFGGLGEVKPDGRKYWFWRLMFAAGAILVMILNFARG